MGREAGGAEESAGAVRGVGGVLGECNHTMHSRSRTMPGRSTSDFHRSDRHRAGGGGVGT